VTYPRINMSQQSLSSQSPLKKFCSITFSLKS
jgi:hypothetical protein